jgi:hypothetical protein
MIVMSAFPSVVSWAGRTFAGQSYLRPSVGGDGVHGGEGKNGKDGNNLPPKRREAGEHADQSLLALMRDNPGGSIAKPTQVSGRSRSSTVLSLKRLEEAGLVNHMSGFFNK